MRQGENHVIAFGVEPLGMQHCRTHGVEGQGAESADQPGDHDVEAHNLDPHPMARWARSSEPSSGRSADVALLHAPVGVGGHLVAPTPVSPKTAIAMPTAPAGMLKLNPEAMSAHIE